jgi:hypothetical protein
MKTRNQMTIGFTSLEHFDGSSTETFLLLPSQLKELLESVCREVDDQLERNSSCTSYLRESALSGSFE